MPRRRAVPAARRRLMCQRTLSHLPIAGAPSAARRLTLGHRALVQSHSPARSRQVAQRRIHATLGYERERRATVYRREEGLPHGPGDSRQLAHRRSARRDSVLAVHICPRAAPAGDWHPEPGLFEPSSPLASVASLPGPTFEGGPGVVLTAAPRCRPWRCARRFSLFAARRKPPVRHPSSPPAVQTRHSSGSELGRSYCRPLTRSRRRRRPGGAPAGAPAAAAKAGPPPIGRGPARRDRRRPRTSATAGSTGSR